MSVDIIRTIILPVLLLTVIVAISLYFYKEGFAVFTYEKDPTCPVGSYSTKTGGICTGTNKTTDSTGDLPNSFSGAPDPTCARGSGTSKKTGGTCTGANPTYNYGTATATPNLFGNAGGSVMPTNTPRTTTTQSALTYNPNEFSPLLDASDNDMYNVYRFVSDSSGSSTDPSANPVIAALANILNGVSASAPASAPASASASAAPLPKKPSTTTAAVDDGIVGHLAGGQGCPIEEEECCEVDCEESISMKQGRTLKKNKCKPYVATNNVPCWGC